MNFHCVWQLLLSQKLLYDELVIAAVCNAGCLRSSYPQSYLMNRQVKQKLCWNCEGSVATFIENCPYCGVYLSPEHQEELNFNLLKPPYPLQSEDNTDVPKAPYIPEDKNEAVPVKEKKIWKIEFSSFETVIPLILLTTGTVFTLFALALYLFANNGMFTLQWDADYWYIYALIAVPALCLGWYTLQHVKDEVETENKT